MKKNIYTSALAAMVAIAGITTNVYGQSNAPSGGLFKKVGAAGGQFLKIPVGARANGMAGAFSAVADDLSAVYWNPAGISRVRGISANVSYNRWIADFTHNFAAVGIPINENYTAAVSFVSFSTGDIPKTTIEEPNGTGEFYSVNDYAFGLTFAGKITEQFSFGINGKYVQNGFSNVSSDGFVFDAGTSYETGIQGIKLGFSIHNFGGDQQFSGQDLNVNNQGNNNGTQAEVTTPFALPLAFRAGISSNVLEGDETNQLIVALDFETLSDTPEQFAIGTEYTWNDLLIARAGYRLGHDEFGLGVGAGVRYMGSGFGGQIDYSLNPTSELGWVNRLTASFQLK